MVEKRQKERAGPGGYYITAIIAYLYCSIFGLNWFMVHLGRATCFVHRISAQTSQEGIECTEAKV